jgi:hypothetical protein
MAVSTRAAVLATLSDSETKALKLVETLPPRPLSACIAAGGGENGLGCS